MGPYLTICTKFVKTYLFLIFLLLNVGTYHYVLVIGKPLEEVDNNDVDEEKEDEGVFLDESVEILNTPTRNKTSASREGKANSGSWSLFTLIHFPNTGCVTPTGRGGTCYTKRACWKRGGTAEGTCAQGFGVCCVFQISCGERAKQNCTYLTNPNAPGGFTLPANTSAQCDFRIIKAKKNVCQLRLDFRRLELFGVQEGECQVDMLSILATGLGAGIPQLCGNNTGQHVYVDVPSGTDSVDLRVALGFLASNPDFARRFEIKVTQVKCNSPMLAPPGCRQYFSGPTGVIKSFNYVSPSSLMEGYPINQNYGICIRKEAGYCSIRYTKSGPFQFGISDADDTTALAGDNCMQDAADGGSRDDFLIIPGGSGLLPSPETADRYCGGDFVPITTSSMPYIVNVVSGDKFDGEVGFMLNYQQLPCANNG